MKLYHIMLFAHICALLAAVLAATLTHFADSRMRAAQTVGEVRPWGLLVGKVSRVFPIALLVLVATGAYMVNKAWSWKFGWVSVALIGVVLLFVGGGYLGARGAALKRALGGSPDTPVSADAARMLHDPLMHSVSWANSLLAIGIVYIMVNKPGLVDSLIALLVSVAIGVAIALVPSRVARKEGATAMVEAEARKRG